MWYGLLADLVVALHTAYVAFVVVGQLVIVVGVVCRWQWVRNFWFRTAHLVAIAYVAYEAISGIECPLTVWERELRYLTGQPVSGETFIGRLLRYLIFYDFEPWVFTTAYILFTLLVLATFVLAPPRWRRASSQPIASDAPESVTPSSSPEDAANAKR